MNITELKGIGEKTAQMLERIGIEKVEDFMTLPPRKYMTFPYPVIPSGLKEGTAAVYGYIRGGFTNGAKGSRKLTVEDDYGTFVTITWFGMPYIERMLCRGKLYVFYGDVKEYYGGFYMVNPTFFTLEDYMKQSGVIRAIYPSTKGLSQDTIRKLVRTSIEMFGSEIPIPEELYKKHGLLDHEDALWDLHFPEREELIEPARRTLAFEELFHLLYTVRAKNHNPMRNPYQIQGSEIRKRIEEILPYKLTVSQNKVLGEIEGDFAREKVANRLIQGDVGSGKTIVALIALMEVADSGYQAAFMAPTTILAKQHYEELAHICKKMDREDLMPVFLSGDMTLKQKKLAYKSIETGEAKIIIGTHAMIQDQVAYQNLALAIIDEQQRFGVNQRLELCQKGDTPHLILMTATPIPRTLGNILYGGMAISIMKEKPAHRLPILTRAMRVTMKKMAFEVILEQLAQGHQAYIICPMVEEASDLMSVNEYMEKMKQFLPYVKCGYLHGQMNAKEKKSVMDDFANGDTQILISTTVVEVGVDVPNATVVMIENAERFGMLQLHQIRGRVGRGADQSYCILLYSEPELPERLQVLEETNDGFEISEHDYVMRGSGELNGTRQSGDMGLHFADFFRDRDLLEMASNAVKELLPI